MSMKTSSSLFSLHGANPRLSHNRLLTLFALLVFSCAAPAADERNPFAGNAKAAKAGEYEFRINCALCHGLGARGGGRVRI